MTNGQISMPAGAVNTSSTTLPVLQVSAGSKMSTSASVSAAVRCSTPRGTTHNSPGPSVTRFAVAELDGHVPAPDEEKLVFLVVMVPREHARELDQLEFLAVELRDDLGPPVFVDAGKLFGEGSLVHMDRSDSAARDSEQTITQDYAKG